MAGTSSCVDAGNNGLVPVSSDIELSSPHKIVCYGTVALAF